MSGASYDRGISFTVITGETNRATPHHRLPTDTWMTYCSIRAGVECFKASLD